MNSDEKPIEWSLLLIAAVLFVLMFLGHIACGDEVAAARDRLKAIEAEKRQLEQVASAKAAQEIAEQAAPLFPEPDPISERTSPVIQFSRAVSAAETAPERLPRAVLVTSQSCVPCERLKRENADLIGGPEAPIQLVKNWLANDLDKWGLTPSMQIYGTPYVFILDKDGKIHGLTPSGLGCRLPGYHSREDLLEYLKLHDHGVDISPVVAPEIIATVTDAGFSAETFAAVLSAHLIEVSGKEPDLTNTVGGLFDFEFDVNDDLRSKAAKLLQTQTIAFASAGITVDWTGPSRSFTVRADGVSITPPIKVTLNKWLVKYSCSLDGVTYTPDLSRVRLLLTGAPDVTVVLK